MLRRFSAILGIALFTALVAPTAAHAEGYAPDTPTSPTLAGSSAIGVCESDVPWIDYSVTLTDPSNVATSHTAYLHISDGTNTTEIRLGELQNGSLSGRVLWPGAAVGADGRGNGWPGWSFVNGQWVTTAGNYAWTRGTVTAELRVNPQLTVALSYPPPTAACATDPAAIAGSAAALAATGGGGPTFSFAVAGGIVLVAGVLLLVIMRRRRRDQR